MILVTGGAGYIGSQVAADLLDSYSVSVIDNLSTGHQPALPAEAPFIKIDLLDDIALDHAFNCLHPKAVLHFAAKSIVSESISDPLSTFYTNLTGTINLLRVMQKYNTRILVFSSTAAVYGEPLQLPIAENHPLKPTNPYGESKLYIEQILSRLAATGNIKYISLRYFNASGADLAAQRGEDHSPETHLIPLVLQTASGRSPELVVYGADYPTPDGTPIRDYIHVTDLVSAHRLALEALLKGSIENELYNLGNEQGYSVLEIIKCAEKITGKKVPYRFGPRRQGDPSVLIASSNKIKHDLSWKPRYSDLETIIETAWNWHRKNPDGFPKKRV